MLRRFKEKFDMNRVRKFIISLGVVAVLAVGSSATLAKSNAAKQRVVSGRIIKLDRGARTMTVRDDRTNDTLNVLVPVDMFIRTNNQSFPVNFEHLLIGMTVRDVTVQ
jgi:hypothetical protein